MEFLCFIPQEVLRDPETTSKGITRVLLVARYGEVGEYEGVVNVELIFIGGFTHDGGDAGCFDNQELDRAASHRVIEGGCEFVIPSRLERGKATLPQLAVVAEV
ncbi:hypothetical protein Hypma_003698 [Hypsizygus marmoreus]|uniref:Uncharacterized protein n=1 Tax=Hypsizygus marmoreus TaxID=39966 RepID=A0A369J5R7_HYPMA|nr:hypothetical protein Hypma_003698 [Hypsizygus marmoreus]